jgi:hypothetical protein
LSVQLRHATILIRLKFNPLQNIQNSTLPALNCGIIPFAAILVVPHCGGARSALLDVVANVDEQVFKGVGVHAALVCHGHSVAVVHEAIVIGLVLKEKKIGLIKCTSVTN